MIILNKDCFKLPRIEKSQFINLLKLGIKYDQNQKTYRINNYNNIGKLIDALSSILNNENILFLQNCIICQKNFPCSTCNYTQSCKTKDLPFECVCPSCLKKTSVLYKNKKGRLKKSESFSN